MPVFVILALALAVVSLATVALAFGLLRRGLAGLRTALMDTRTRLAPVLEELRDEAAVTAVEQTALVATVEQLQRSRRARRGGLLRRKARR